LLFLLTGITMLLSIGILVLVYFVKGKGRSCFSGSLVYE
jgi:hypothetical protein